MMDFNLDFKHVILSHSDELVGLPYIIENVNT